MALKKKQKIAAEIMVANPEKPLTEIAKELEVNYSTFWRWRQNPEFKEYEDKLCQERFHDMQRIAIQKLQENAMKGNQKAIEYILDYMGYKAATKIEADVDTDIVINITGDSDDDTAEHR